MVLPRVYVYFEAVLAVAEVLHSVDGSARGEGATRDVVKQLAQLLVAALGRRQHACQVAIIMSSLPLPHLSAYLGNINRAAAREGVVTTGSKQRIMSQERSNLQQWYVVSTSRD